VVLVSGSQRRQRGERGAIIVLSALVVVGMLGMTALAIDIANTRQQRRQAQASADAAALAGAQDLPDATKVVATVKQYASTNFSVPASAWEGCKDFDHLSQLPDLASSNSCISIDEAFTRVRVQLPERQIHTYFAGAIGVADLTVAANAEAESALRRDDRIIPATVATSSGSGNLCIENSGNDSDCASRSSGNFGSFDSRRMSLYKPSSQVQNDSLRINYAMGVDHALVIYGTGSSKVCDVSQLSPCTTTNTSGKDANHLIPFTGNAVPPLTDGLVDNATISTDVGKLLFCGRLRRPDLTDENLAETAPENCNHWADAPGPGPSLTVIGEKINGRHVAYWMKPEFRTLFYGSVDPQTQNTASSSWATGDAKLECFLRSYRFDYGGSSSKGHVAQTEFFIDPTSTLDPTTADGTEFTLAQAKSYLINTCKLDAATVNDKLASLTDQDRFWPMFDKGMVTDPRFGMIPVIKNWSNGSSTAMPIARFWTVFLYRLYASSTKVKAVDAWVFEPALIETDSGIADLQFGYQSNQPKVHLVE
jgi:Tfp pilus assembly protein PilX